MGFKVASFKVGPDFIDSGHHTKITGIASRNLDGWMLSKKYNLETFEKHTQGNADIAVIEGVMGLFDGYDGKSEAGSTAQMAKWIGLPIILVVDAKSMARSVAALVQGFEGFDNALSFAGVIFNNVGSKRHLQYLKDAMQDNVKMQCLGGIIRDKEITIPERHLGLVTTRDHALSNENIDKLADTIKQSIDINALLDILPNVNIYEKSKHVAKQKNASTRIAVAMDNAFCFYYQDNLDMLKTNGAELIYFSPIKNETLPSDIDGIYFGGGYPELFAKQLSENFNIRQQIKEKSDNGIPIYGECGGFMYLCEKLCAVDGKQYPMTGCFPFAIKMLPRLKSLGYREITLNCDTIIGKRGQIIRGHEFHYSEITANNTKNIKTVYKISTRTGIDKTNEGYQINRTLGSYIHLHFGSFSPVTMNFVKSCSE